VEPKAAGFDPLLVIQAKSQFDWQLRLSLNNFLSLLCRLFTCVEPLEGRNNHLEGTSSAFKLSDYFSAALFVSGCKTDFLYGGIIETQPAYNDACTTDLWPEIRLDSLNLDVVVAEIDWPSCELLAI